MKKSGTLRRLCAALGMAALILDSKSALLGASQGLELAVRSVIPTLFPYFVLTDLLLSQYSSILPAAVFGGYPMGARAVGIARQQGSLTDSQANGLLMFCSNAGPSFIFGILGSQFSDPLPPWLIWAVHLLSAFLVSRWAPCRSFTKISVAPRTLPQAVSHAVRALATVCGWVVLFRMLIAFLDRWVLWLLPAPGRVLLCGMLELTNGCCMLDTVPSEELRFLLACSMLSFGGLCVAMQTRSVIGPLSIRPYLLGKLLQCGYSLLLALLVLPAVEYRTRLAALALTVLPFFRRNRKNNSSIPGPVIV